MSSNLCQFYVSIDRPECRVEGKPVTVTYPSGTSEVLVLCPQHSRYALGAQHNASFAQRRLEDKQAKQQKLARLRGEF